jgi:general secretion pathway protein B
MSYILDALRRAESERERGTVPSIHAQQFALVPGEDEAGGRPKALLWVIGGLAAALLAALGWNFLGRDPTRAAATAQAPPPATPVAGPPAVLAVLPAPAIAASSSLPAVPALAASTAPLPVADAGRPVRRTNRKVAASAGSAGTASTEPRIATLRELPDEIRKSLPNATVNGSTYSIDSANRMLMINGQIFHEGDAVAAGLVLQQIKPRAAVFAFKGYRYEIAF